jgi:hypothetical protein
VKLCSNKINLEVGYKFFISHKVNKVMMSLLTREVMQPNQLDVLNPDVFLNLQVSTDSVTTSVSVEKPSGIINDFLTWRMTLPYSRINESQNYLEEYLDCFFEGAVRVFSHYGVDEASVLSVKDLVKAEVLDNPEYEYVQKYTSKVAKYDFD